MSKMFDDLKRGLEEVFEYKKGKNTLRSEMIVLLDPPREYSAKDIKRIRKKKNYSQEVLAKILNVSIKTVQAWESGERAPSHAALRLLEIVDHGLYPPEEVSA